MLFTISGNGPHASLKDHPEGPGTNRDHYVVNFISKIIRTSSRLCTRRQKTLETIDELTAFLAMATLDGMLGRLLYRGAAWSLMRRKAFCPRMRRRSARRSIPILQNTASRCFGAQWPFVLRPSSDLTNKAFERAGNAFEALVRNADPGSPDRGFRRTIAATAYHLAGFSAVAYSLFNEAAGDLNLTPGETAIRPADTPRSRSVFELSCATGWMMRHMATSG